MPQPEPNKAPSVGSGAGDGVGSGPRSAQRASSAPGPNKTISISWDQFHRDCRTLAERLHDAGPFHAIVCIPGGGLPPAAIGAQELGIRLIETECVASYSHTTQGELTVIKEVADPIVN